MVCRVEVLMTADLPTRVASRSMFAPSSAASSVTSRSRISTTFPTRYGSCLSDVSILFERLLYNSALRGASSNVNDIPVVLNLL
jgi:hypothetical protein